MSQDSSINNKTYHNDAGDIVPKEESSYSYYQSEDGTFHFNFNDEVPEPRTRSTPKIDWSTLRNEASIEVRERYAEETEVYDTHTFSSDVDWDQLQKDMFLDCAKILGINPKTQYISHAPLVTEDGEFEFGVYLEGRKIELNSNLFQTESLRRGFEVFKMLLSEDLRNEITYEDYRHLTRISTIPHEIFHERQFLYMNDYLQESKKSEYLERPIERSANVFAIRFIGEKIKQLRKFEENKVQLSKAEQILLKYGEQYKLHNLMIERIKNSEIVRIKKARKLGIDTEPILNTKQMLEFYEEEIEYTPMLVPPNTQINRITFETDISSELFYLKFVEDIISANLEGALNENEKDAILQIVENSRVKSRAIATLVNEYRFNTSERMSRKTQADDYTKFLTPIEQLQKRYSEIEEILKAV